MDHQNLERMVAVLTDTLPLRPSDAQVRTRLGEVYQELGRRVEALAALRRAAKDQPHYAAARAGLGAFLVEQGEWAEGEACLLTATRLKPDLVAPYLTLAQ